MNEDELRAFLESATVGDDDHDEAHDAEHAPGAAGEADADPAAAAPGKTPAAPAQDPAERLPSFDELMGIEREPEPPAEGLRRGQNAAPAAPQPADADVELTPLVLPGPGTRPAPAEPVRPPQPAVAPAPQPARRSTAAPDEPAIPADPTQPAPAQPVAARAAAPATQPTPATAPLPTGVDALLGSAGGSGDDDGYEPIAVTGGERGRARFIPWIVVGAGAVVALIAAVLIVFAVRGDGGEPSPTAAPTTTEEPSTPAPTEEEPKPSPTETDAPDSDQPPTVDVGRTGTMDIPAWGVTSQISAKFGWPSYTIDAGGNLVLDGGTLLPEFPESCAAMRTGFGITKKADGSYVVLRPAERCADAPELFDEVWGLTAAIIPTIKPL